MGLKIFKKPCHKHLYFHNFGCVRKKKRVKTSHFLLVPQIHQCHTGIAVGPSTAHAHPISWTPT